MKSKASSNAIVWARPFEATIGIRKLSPASFCPKGFDLRIIAAGLLILLAAVGIRYLQQPVMILSDAVSSVPYTVQPVREGDILEYHWIHSFEHIPWQERYVVGAEGELRLVEIRVAGFGAGIPENKGQVSVENGMVVMREINESFDAIAWIHSETALSKIVLNGRILATGPALPHHQPMKLEVNRRLNSWLKSH